MKVENWGEIPYREALQRQLDLVEKVRHRPDCETLVLCHHPPVVTLGRKARAEDLWGWKGEVVEVQRGGRATYHGPGQWVIYPIIHLGSRSNDLGGHLRALEKAIIDVLKCFDLVGVGKEYRATGVWVNGQKVASIGVAVKRWVTYHGVAFNLYRDPLAFTGINPCGMEKSEMTCLEDLLGHRVERDQMRQLLQQAFTTHLSQLMDRFDQNRPNSGQTEISISSKGNNYE